MTLTGEEAGLLATLREKKANVDFIVTGIIVYTRDPRSENKRSTA